MISGLRIQNFRSCRAVELPGLDKLTVLVGANNTGKSNVLKALSLFFTGFLEGDRGGALEMARDYGGPPKHKRFVQVDVEFQLEDTFHFNKALSHAQDLVGTGCAFRKRWELDAPRPRLLRADALGGHYEPLHGEDERSAEQFLALTDFRFIPTGVDPVEMMLSVRPGVMGQIARSVAQSAAKKGAGAQGTDLLQRLRDAADQLIGPIGEGLAKHVPGLARVTLDIPERLSDLVLSVGLEVQTQQGARLAGDLQGAGVQSRLMYALAALADTAFSLRFGWRQAVIWAVEEPEHSLHTNLEYEVVDFFKETASRKAFQVVASTHSEIMAGHCDTGFHLTLDGGVTRAAPREPLELIQECTRAGVTRHASPVVGFRESPWLLAEGPRDRRYLYAAAGLNGSRIPAVVLSVQDLPGAQEGGGVDALKTWLKNNPKALVGKPEYAPVVALLDWETSEGTRVEVEKRLRQQQPRAVCLLMPADQANPKLGKSVRGIERFLPTSFVKRAARSSGRSWARDSSKGMYEVSPPGLPDAAKDALCNRFCAEASKADTSFLWAALQPALAVLSGAGK